MPVYRVKSGTINLVVDGKRVRVEAGQTMDVTPELATKFKDQLEPISDDAKFVDDEFTEETPFPREYLRIKLRPGERDLYDVLNLLTKAPLNDKPLTLSEAQDLAEGIGIPVEVSYSGVMREEKDEAGDVAEEVKDGIDDSSEKGTGQETTTKTEPKLDKEKTSRKISGKKSEGDERTSPSEDVGGANGVSVGGRTRIK